MNRLIGAITGPITAVGTTVRMAFNRSRGWGVLLARTRIDYRTEIGDPSTNSIVGAVVGWIARNFPEAPVRVVPEGGQLTGETILPGPTGIGAMLRLLERPNRHYSGVLQWMATVVDFIVRGNAYWIKVRSPGGRVIALWWVPERMMEPRWPEDDPSVFIGWYEYTVDGTTHYLRPDDIVHFRNGIDPNNPRKGRSKLDALAREIFTDDEAANFTASLLKNLGVPGVVLSPANSGGPIARTDPESVKTSFMEKFGGDKRGEPLVLTGPTDVKVLSFNPTEMDLKSLRRIPEERVSAVLGVPAGVAQLGAGLDRNTFTNYGEANKAAYTQGVIPDHRLFAAELEVQLLPDFTSDWEAYDVFFDWTQASAMQEAADAIWKRHESAATKGLITRAAFKKAVGAKVDDADEVYVIPNNYLVTPAAGGPPPAPAPVPTRRQLPAGDQATALIPATLESSSDEPAAAVNCAGCGKLLAEAASPPYRIRCSRCKAVTEAGKVAA